MSKYICFTKLKHLIFINGGSTKNVLQWRGMTRNARDLSFHSNEYNIKHLLIRTQKGEPNVHNTGNYFSSFYSLYDDVQREKKVHQNLP
jgi:hypothetical protein